MNISSTKTYLNQNWKGILLSGALLFGTYFITKKALKKNQITELIRIHKIRDLGREFKENAFNQNEKVIIPNKEKLEEKLLKIQTQGPENLQIIMDFDQTITTFEAQGSKCPTCFGIFKQVPSSFMNNFQKEISSDEYLARAEELYKKYHPIEIDNSISIEKKITAMEEWWQYAEEALVKNKITKTKLAEGLKSTNLAIRYGFKSFITTCLDAQVPVYIVSGGIFDMITTILNDYIDDIENNDLVKIFSNVMLFDNNEVFQKFAKPHIHSLFKDKILDKNRKDINLKSNAILIGDTVNDRFMTRSSNCDTVIAIGFLSEKNIDQLSDYQQAYDIVIIGDGNYTQIEMIVRRVLGKPQRVAHKTKFRGTNTPILEFIDIDE